VLGHEVLKTNRVLREPSPAQGGSASIRSPLPPVGRLSRRITAPTRVSRGPSRSAPLGFPRPCETCSTQSADEESLEITRERARQLIEHGHPEADVLRRIEEAVSDAITEAAKPIAEQLKRTSHRMVLEHQSIRRGFEARLAHR